MRVTGSRIAALAILTLIALAVAGVFLFERITERLRIQDAEAAFAPIEHLGCRILSLPAPFYRYCHYSVEFPRDCKLSDENASELLSLNKLPQQNSLYVFVDAPDLTDRSVSQLMAIRTMDVLHLTDTSISDQGISKLREALPDCKITTGKLDQVR